MEYKINDGNWIDFNDETQVTEIKVTDQLKVRSRTLDSSRYGRSLTVKQN